MEKVNRYECSYCHEIFNIWDTRLVNRGIKGKEVRICCDCVEAAYDSGRVILCDVCGEVFTSDMLHDEQIHGHSFTACPACCRDVVYKLTQKKFEEVYRPCRYAVIVRRCKGEQRGYIVSVEGGISDAIKKLAGKVNLDGVASINAAEILTEEDEF